MKKSRLEQLIAIFMMLLIVDTPFVYGQTAGTAPTAPGKKPEDVAKNLQTNPSGVLPSDIVKAEGGPAAVREKLIPKDAEKLNAEQRAAALVGTDAQSGNANSVAGAIVKQETGIKGTVTLTEDTHFKKGPGGEITAEAGNIRVPLKNLGKSEYLKITSTPVGEGIKKLGDQTSQATGWLMDKLGIATDSKPAVQEFSRELTKSTGYSLAGALGLATHEVEITATDKKTGKQKPKKIRAGDLEMGADGRGRVSGGKGKEGKENKVDLEQFDEAQVTDSTIQAKHENGDNLMLIGENIDVKAEGDKVSITGPTRGAVYSKDQRLDLSTEGKTSTIDLTYTKEGMDVHASGDKASVSRIPNDKDIANKNSFFTQGNDVSLKVKAGELAQGSVKGIGANIKIDDSRTITDISTDGTKPLMYFAKSAAPIQDLAKQNPGAKIVVDQSGWVGKVQDAFVREGGIWKDVVTGSQDNSLVTAKPIPGGARQYSASCNGKCSDGLAATVRSEYAFGAGMKELTIGNTGRKAAVEVAYFAKTGSDGKQKIHGMLTDFTIKSAAALRETKGAIIAAPGTEFVMGDKILKADRSGIQAISPEAISPTKPTTTTAEGGKESGRQTRFYIPNEALFKNAEAYRTKLAEEQAKIDSISKKANELFTQNKIDEAIALWKRELKVSKTKDDIAVAALLAKGDIDGARAIAEKSRSRENLQTAASALDAANRKDEARKIRQNLPGEASSFLDDFQTKYMIEKAGLTAKSTTQDVREAAGRAGHDELIGEFTGDVRLMDANRRLAEARTFDNTPEGKTARTKEIDYLSEVRADAVAKGDYETYQKQKVIETARTADRFGDLDQAIAHYNLMLANKAQFGEDAAQLAENRLKALVPTKQVSELITKGEFEQAAKTAESAEAAEVKEGLQKYVASVKDRTTFNQAMAMIKQGDSYLAETIAKGITDKDLQKQVTAAITAKNDETTKKLASFDSTIKKIQGSIEQAKKIGLIERMTGAETGEATANRLLDTSITSYSSYLSSLSREMMQKEIDRVNNEIANRGLTKDATLAKTAPDLDAEMSAIDAALKKRASATTLDFARTIIDQKIPLDQYNEGGLWSRIFGEKPVIDERSLALQQGLFKGSAGSELRATAAQEATRTNTDQLSLIQQGKNDYTWGNYNLNDPRTSQVAEMMRNAFNDAQAQLEGANLFSGNNQAYQAYVQARSAELSAIDFEKNSGFMFGDNKKQALAQSIESYKDAGATADTSINPFAKGSTEYQNFEYSMNRIKTDASVQIATDQMKQLQAFNAFDNIYDEARGLLSGLGGWGSYVLNYAGLETPAYYFDAARTMAGIDLDIQMAERASELKTAQEARQSVTTASSISDQFGITPNMRIDLVQSKISETLKAQGRADYEDAAKRYASQYFQARNYLAENTIQGVPSYSNEAAFRQDGAIQQATNSKTMLAAIAATAMTAGGAAALRWAGLATDLLAGATFGSKVAMTAIEAGIFTGTEKTIDWATTGHLPTASELASDYIHSTLTFGFFKGTGAVAEAVMSKAEGLIAKTGISYIQKGTIAYAAMQTAAHLGSFTASSFALDVAENGVPKNTEEFNQRLWGSFLGAATFMGAAKVGERIGVGAAEKVKDYQVNSAKRGYLSNLRTIASTADPAKLQAHINDAETAVKINPGEFKARADEMLRSGYSGGKTVPGPEVIQSLAAERMYNDAKDKGFDEYLKSNTRDMLSRQAEAYRRLSSPDRVIEDIRIRNEIPSDSEAFKQKKQQIIKLGFNDKPTDLEVYRSLAAERVAGRGTTEFKPWVDSDPISLKARELAGIDKPTQEHYTMAREAVKKQFENEIPARMKENPKVKAAIIEALSKPSPETGPTGELPPPETAARFLETYSSESRTLEMDARDWIYKNAAAMTILSKDKTKKDLADDPQFISMKAAELTAKSQLLDARYRQGELNTWKDALLTTEPPAAATPTSDTILETAKIALGKESKSLEVARLAADATQKENELAKATERLNDIKDSGTATPENIIQAQTLVEMTQLRASIAEAARNNAAVEMIAMLRQENNLKLKTSEDLASYQSVDAELRVRQARLLQEQTPVTDTQRQEYLKQQERTAQKDWFEAQTRIEATNDPTTSTASHEQNALFTAFIDRQARIDDLGAQFREAATKESANKIETALRQEAEEQAAARAQIRQINSPEKESILGDSTLNELRRLESEREIINSAKTMGADNAADRQKAQELMRYRDAENQAELEKIRLEITLKKPEGIIEEAKSEPTPTRGAEKTFSDETIKSDQLKEAINQATGTPDLTSRIIETVSRNSDPSRLRGELIFELDRHLREKGITGQDPTKIADSVIGKALQSRLTKTQYGQVEKSRANYRNAEALRNLEKEPVGRTYDELVRLREQGQLDEPMLERLKALEDAIQAAEKAGRSDEANRLRGIDKVENGKVVKEGLRVWSIEGTGDPALDRIIDKAIREYEAGENRRTQFKDQFFSITKAQATEAISPFISNQRIGIEFALAGGKTSTISPITMAIMRLATGRTGVYFSPTGMSEAAYNAMKSLEGMGLKTYHLSSIDNLASQLNNILTADVIIAPVENIGFLRTKILRGNMPLEELHAAVKVYEKMSRNVQAMFDEAQITQDVKLHYRSGEEGTPATEKQKADARIVLAALQESGVINVRDSIVRTDALTEPIIKDGQTIESAKFNEATKSRLAEIFARETNLPIEEVKEFMKHGEDMLASNPERYRNLAGLVDTMNSFAEAIKRAPDTTMSLGEDGMIKVASGGNEQTNQQLNKANAALANEIVGQIKYGSKNPTKNIDLIKTSGESVQSSIAGYLEDLARPGMNSGQGSFTGTFADLADAMQYGYKMRLNLNKEILNAALSKVDKENVLGFEGGNDAALDWIKSRKGELQGNHFEVVFESGGNRPLSEYITRLMGDFPEFSVLERNARGESVLHKRKPDGTIEKIILKPDPATQEDPATTLLENSETSPLLNGAKTRKVIAVMGQGGATGTNYRAKGDVPEIVISSAKEGLQWRTVQAINRADRIMGETAAKRFLIVTEVPKDILADIITGKTDMKSAFVERMSATEKNAQAQALLDTLHQAADFTANRFFEEIIFRDPLSAKAELARKALRAFQNQDKDTLNLNTEIRAETSQEALQRKFDAINRFFEKLRTSDEYAEFRSTFTDRENSIVETNSKPVKVEFAKIEIKAEQVGRSAFSGETTADLAGIIKTYIPDSKLPKYTASDHKAVEAEVVKIEAAATPVEERAAAIEKTLQSEIETAQNKMAGTDRIEAVKKIGNAGPLGAPAINTLVTILADPNSGADLSIAAIESAGKIGSRDPIDLLTEIQSDPTRPDQVRRAASDAIIKIQGLTGPAPEIERPVMAVGAPSISSTWSGTYVSPALARAAGYASAIGLSAVGATLANAASTVASAATTATAEPAITSAIQAGTTPMVFMSVVSVGLLAETGRRIYNRWFAPTVSEMPAGPPVEAPAEPAAQFPEALSSEQMELKDLRPDPRGPIQYQRPRAKPISIPRVIDKEGNTWLAKPAAGREQVVSIDREYLGSRYADTFGFLAPQARKAVINGEPYILTRYIEDASTNLPTSVTAQERQHVVALFALGDIYDRNPTNYLRDSQGRLIAIDFAGGGPQSTGVAATNLIRSGMLDPRYGTSPETLIEQYRPGLETLRRMLADRTGFESFIRTSLQTTGLQGSELKEKTRHYVNQAYNAEKNLREVMKYVYNEYKDVPTTITTYADLSRIISNPLEIFDAQAKEGKRVITPLPLTEQEIKLLAPFTIEEYNAKDEYDKAIAIRQLLTNVNHANTKLENFIGNQIPTTQTVDKLAEQLGLIRERDSLYKQAVEGNGVNWDAIKGYNLIELLRDPNKVKEAKQPTIPMPMQAVTASSEFNRLTTQGLTAAGLTAGTLLATPAAAWAGQMLTDSPEIMTNVVQASTGGPLMIATLAMSTLGTLIGMVKRGYKIPPSPIRAVKPGMEQGDRYWNEEATETNVDTLRALNEQGEVLAAIIKTGEIGRLVTAYAAVDETGQIYAVTARKEELPPEDLQIAIVWDGQSERYTGVEALTPLTSADQSKMVDDIATAAAQANTMMEKKGGAAILTALPTTELASRSIADAIAAGTIETARAIKINLAVNGFRLSATRESSKSYLIEQGEAAVPALIRGLRAMDKDVKRGCIETLGEIKSKDAVPELGRIAADISSDLIYPAIDALAKIDTPEAQEQLINNFNKLQRLRNLQLYYTDKLAKTTPNAQTHTQILNSLIINYDSLRRIYDLRLDPGESTKTIVMKSLTRYTRAAEQHGLQSPALIQRLSDSIPETPLLKEYIRTLGEIGPQARPAVGKILDVIEAELNKESPDQDTLDEAYRAIGSIKPQSKEDLDRIKDIIIRHYPTEWESGIETLPFILQLGKIGKPAIPILIDILNQIYLASPGSRVHLDEIATALSEIGPDAIEAILQEINPAKPQMAIRLIKALELMKNQGISSVDYLKKTFDEAFQRGEINLVRSIIRAIGEIAPEEATELLIRATKTTGVEEAAIEQLGKIGQYVQTEKTRKAAVQAAPVLIEIITELEPLISHTPAGKTVEEGSLRRSLSAIRALGRITAQTEQTEEIVTLFDRLLEFTNKQPQTKESDEFKIEIISALTNIGPQAKTSIPRILDTLEEATRRYPIGRKETLQLIDQSAQAIRTIGADQTTIKRLENLLIQNRKRPTNYWTETIVEGNVLATLKYLAQNGDTNAAIAIAAHYIANGETAYAETALSDYIPQGEEGNEAVKPLLDNIYQRYKEAQTPTITTQEKEAQEKLISFAAQSLAKIGTEDAILSLKELIRRDDELSATALESITKTGIRNLATGETGRVAPEIEPAVTASLSRNIKSEQETASRIRDAAINYLTRNGNEQTAKDLEELMLNTGEKKTQEQIQNAIQEIRTRENQAKEIEIEVEKTNKKALALASRFSKKDGITGCATSACIETEGISAQIRQMTESGQVSELIDYLESLSDEMDKFEKAVGVKQEIRPAIDDTLKDLETTRTMVESYTKSLQREYGLTEGQQKKLMMIYLTSPKDFESQMRSIVHDILNPMSLSHGFNSLLADHDATKKSPELAQAMKIQILNDNNFIRTAKSIRNWDYSMQNRLALLRQYAEWIQTLRRTLVMNLLALEHYRKDMTPSQQELLNDILEGNRKTRNAITYLTEFSPRDIKTQIGDSAREFGIKSTTISPNAKAASTRASIIKALQNFAANSRRAIDTYNQNARERGQPTRTLENSATADYDTATQTIEVTYQDNAGGIDIETVRKNLEKIWKTTTAVKAKLKEIGIVDTNAPQDQLTDNEVIHSILLRGITTKTEEAGEHGIGLYGVVEEMRQSGGWTTKIDWNNKETAAKYKPPVSIEQVKDEAGNTIGTKFTIRMKATDTPRFLLDQSRITTAKIRAIEPETIAQEAIIESAVQTQAGKTIAPIEVAQAKIQTRLEALGLKGKQLQTTLERKMEEVREIIKREETSRGTAWAQEETHALTQEPTTPELATGPPTEWTAEKITKGGILKLNSQQMKTRHPELALPDGTMPLAAYDPSTDTVMVNTEHPDYGTLSKIKAAIAHERAHQWFEKIGKTKREELTIEIIQKPEWLQIKEMIRSGLWPIKEMQRKSEEDLFDELQAMRAAQRWEPTQNPTILRAIELFEKITPDSIKTAQEKIVTNVREMIAADPELSRREARGMVEDLEYKEFKNILADTENQLKTLLKEHASKETIKVHLDDLKLLEELAKDGGYTEYSDIRFKRILLDPWLKSDPIISPYLPIEENFGEAFMPSHKVGNVDGLQKIIEEGILLSGATSLEDLTTKQSRLRGQENAIFLSAGPPYSHLRMRVETKEVRHNHPLLVFDRESIYNDPRFQSVPRDSYTYETNKIIEKYQMTPEILKKYIRHFMANKIPAHEISDFTLKPNQKPAIGTFFPEIILRDKVPLSQARKLILTKDDQIDLFGRLEKSASFKNLVRAKNRNAKINSNEAVKFWIKALYGIDTIVPDQGLSVDQMYFKVIGLDIPTYG